MTQVLKQSTAVDVLIGPFVDSTNGYTAETGVSPAVKLSKNGQALAAKNDVTTPVHDADGYYNCELDATDTNTVGTLTLSVVGSATSLAVRHEYQVVEEAVYDAMYAASAAGPLQSTVAGRTIDVTATGAAGIDWGNVENQTTVVDLSATDIQLCDTVTTLTGHTAQTGDSFARIGLAGAGLTNINLPNQTMDIVGNITGNLSGSVGSVTGAVGSVTAGVTLAAGAVTNASLADNMEIVFETDFATNYNQVSNAWVTNFTDIIGSYTAQTGDSYARLGAPAGVSVSADIAAVKVDTAAAVADTNELQTDWANGGRLDLILDDRASQTTADAIETDTQDIQSRLPAALIGGRMDSDVEAINNDTNAADHLAAHALTAVDVTFSAGGTTTTAVLNQVDAAGASSTDDVYNGRILIFTAPAGLKYQATDITDYDGGTLTATITAVTQAPVASATAIMV